MGRLLRWLNSESPAEATPRRAAHSLDAVRRLMLESLADCGQDERLRRQLAGADDAQQLWQMRCEIYQAIARRHCEAEAVRRLNALLPFFKGWLPASALTPL